MITNITKSIQALLLLFFIVSANFLGVTLDTELQSKIKTEPVLLNFIIFGIIYFTIILSSESGKQSSPLTVFRYSLYIYVLYLLLSRQPYPLFIINLIFIMVIYILTNQIQYQRNNGIETNIEFYEKSIDYLEIILFLTLSIGVYHHFESCLASNPDIDLVNYFFKPNSC